MIRQCERCGQDYESPYSGAKYCPMCAPRKTHTQDIHTGPPRTCACCGKTFVPNTGKQRFCGAECRLRWNNAKYKARLNGASFKETLANMPVRGKRGKPKPIPKVRERKPYKAPPLRVDGDVKMYYCVRMRVTATALPCGSREECWHSVPCESIPRTMTTPPKKDHHEWLRYPK